VAIKLLSSRVLIAAHFHLLLFTAFSPTKYMTALKKYMTILKSYQVRQGPRFGLALQNHEPALLLLMLMNIILALQYNTSRSAHKIKVK
jgi:hypothetical protein